MLGEFRIEPTRVRNYAGSYQGIYQSLEQYNGELEDVLGGLRDHVYGNVPNTLRRVMEKNEVNIQDVKKLEEALLLIVQKYQDAENRIVNGESGDDFMIPVDVYGPASEDILNGNSQDVGLEEESEDTVLEFIWDALKQAVLGNFTEDGNWLGIALSVGIGFIPYVGLAADVRDVIADIWNLIDDGPETKEWVSLAFDLVGVIPGIGDFCKHADDMGPLYRNLDKIAEGLGDATKGILKKGDEIISTGMQYVDDIFEPVSEFLDQHVLDGLTSKVDDIIDGIPDARDVVDKVSDFWNKGITDHFASVNKTIGDGISGLIDDAAEISDTVQGWIADGLDFITGNKKEDVGDCTFVDSGFSFAF